MFAEAPGVFLMLFQVTLMQWHSRIAHLIPSSLTKHPAVPCHGGRAPIP